MLFGFLLFEEDGSQVSIFLAYRCEKFMKLSVEENLGFICYINNYSVD
jgi:hypothetical protein